VEGPADTDEAPIPTEPESMNLSGTTTTLKRKAAKRTCVTKLTAANIKSSPEEDIPARKKPRLQVQASLPAIVAADADTLNASPDAGVTAPVASVDAGRYPMAASPMKSNNVEAFRLPLHWTPEEDTKLASAVNTTCKKKHHGEYRTDWVAITALFPGRTKQQCYRRWHNSLHSKSDETTARKGIWTKEGDVELKDAVEKHIGKHWEATAVLLTGRTGKWTKEEDSKLKDAVEKHNGNNWASIAALVPGRTTKQCKGRWHDKLDSKSDETTARTGKWTKEEDGKLKDAVEKHNGNNWAFIAALVPGRTHQQCWYRWNGALACKSDETTAHVSKWIKEKLETPVSTVN
jgi:phage gpG-like protein